MNTATRAAVVDGDPFAAAARHLRTSLGELSAAAGHAAPRVAVLGGYDVLTGPDPARRLADVHLTPSAILVGPWSPAADAPAACGHCLGVRWQRLRTRSERDALEVGSEMRASPEWPMLPGYVIDAVWNLYEAVILAPSSSLPRPAVDRHSASLPMVSSLDLRTLSVRTMPLLADPLCPSCGVTSDPSPVVTLEARVKSHPRAYRLQAVDGYATPTAALANPICGALGAGTAMNVTSETTAPVTGSVFIRGYGGLLDVSWSGQSNSFEVSRHLAYLEGVERYAGTHRRRNVAPIIAAYRDIADEALDPASCGLYPDDTYEHDPILSPYSPAARIPWIRGWSVRDNRPILVPRRLCFYSSGAAGDNFVLSSSSGCATGSSLEEAMLYGLLELIERDSFLLGWYGNVELPRIDLDTCGGTFVRAMVDRAALQGYDIRAYDNRIDLAVPSVTAVAVRRDGGLGALSFAAAAHVDPEEAVEGALSEALTYIAHQERTTRRRQPELEAMTRDFDLVYQLADHSALFGLPEMTHYAESYLRPVAAQPLSHLYAEWDRRRPMTLDLTDDLRACIGELVGAGLDVIVVDQTTPEQEPMGLRSVCMIAPGLLPIDFGWRRQRALGMTRLRTAIEASGRTFAEEDIRRVPHPFP